MKRRNLFLWYLGVGLKDPKRIFDMVKFWEVQKAVKNLTIIIKKKVKFAAAAELQWRDVSSYSGCFSEL